MARSLTHFLFGATLVLLVGTAITLRYGLDRDWGLWLVPAGGVWGLVPDVHHVSPVREDQIYALHNSPVVDVFALHYTLDQPISREMPHAGILASLLFFTCAVAVFSLAPVVRDRLDPPQTTRGRLFTAAAGGAVAAGYGVVAATAVFLHTGRLPVLAALAGFGNLGGLTLLFAGLVVLSALAVVGGLLVALAFEAVASPRHTTGPVAGATLGTAVSLVSWAGVAVLVALWMAAVHGVAIPVPWFHWPALAGLAAFGATCGLFYALLRGAFVRPSTTARPQGMD